MSNKITFFRNFTCAAIGTLLMTGTVSAAPRVSDRHDASALRHDFHIEGRILPGEDVTINGVTYRVAEPKSRHYKKPAKAPGENDVIYSVSGRPQEYTKQSGGYVSDGRIYPYQDSGQSAAIVWDDDRCYFWNILSYAETDSYVAAELFDNEILMEMNQAVVDLVDFKVVLGLLKTLAYTGPNPDWEPGDPDDEKNLNYIDFVYSDEYDFVTFSYNKEGTIELIMPETTEYEPDPDLPEGFQQINPAENNLPLFIFGFYYSDDLLWTGDGDLYQTYEVFDYERVTYPADLPADSYSYINSDGSGVIVSVGREDNTIYFQGLSAYLPDAVFKAEIVESDGKKVLSVAPDQYIGKSSDGYYNLITRTACYDNKTGKLGLAPDNRPAIVELTFDDDGNITEFTATDDVLFFSYISPDYDPYDQFSDMTLSRQLEAKGVPVDPKVDYADDYTSFLGAVYFFFFMSPMATDGTVLDANDLYYRIYVNGKPFTFMQEEGENLKGEFITKYVGITEPTDLVPFYFYNGQDLFYDAEHLYYVGLYMPYSEIYTLGVQAVYNYEGEYVESGIDTLVVHEDAAVDEVMATEISTEYYDLTGRKVMNPSNGIVIRKTTLSDGRVITKKVVGKK